MRTHNRLSLREFREVKKKIIKVLIEKIEKELVFEIVAKDVQIV